MATRCNVRVRGHTFSLMLYRHWDGYPAETGASLYKVANRFSKQSPAAHMDHDLAAARIATALLQEHQLGANVNGTPRFDYEITDGVHGDIDHYYEILVGWPEIQIRHAARRDATEEEDWHHKCETYTLAEWRDMVNHERNQITKRVQSRWPETAPLDLLA